jgi:LysR family cyn operon transcriptional activator
MELRHLRYFVALAEQLSFTQAAEKVHVTQSTLSHQIKQLEDELDCPLFERQGKRVVMTDRGEAFLEYAQRALREVEQGVKTLRDASDELTGQVRVGTTHTFNMHILPRSAALFLEQHPSVSVQIMEMSGDQVAAELQAGRLDFGITYKPENTTALLFEPLYNEEMRLVVGPMHPFARRRFVRMAELHGQRVVLVPGSFATRSLLDECFKMANAQPVVVAEMNAVVPMIEFVNHSNVAAIVSEYAVGHGDARVIPLQSPTPVRTPGLLWLRDQPRTPAIRHFAAIIRERVNELNLRRLRGK